MALPASGNSISLNQVNVELGNSGTAAINMGSAAVRGLFGVSSGAIAMSDGFGKANQTILSNAGNINSLANRQQITVSDYISAGETLAIPENFWVWSDNTSIAAMIVDIACTIKISGRVIGKGGNGGRSSQIVRTVGGPAISITSTGVTIENLSGAYIAGGGGGGGAASNYSGSGGGAGGGAGGPHEVNYPSNAEWVPPGGGVGGVIGATGSGTIKGRQHPNQIDAPGASGGVNGGAGGGGGTYIPAGTYAGVSTGGGGGGRILPGSGGAGGVYSGQPHSGGAGGGAGNAGSNGGGGEGSGGGGGWGAAGGRGYNAASSPYGGAAGGAAIVSTQTYTLTNNGTVYGAT